MKNACEMDSKPSVPLWGEALTRSPGMTRYILSELDGDHFRVSFHAATCNSDDKLQIAIKATSKRIGTLCPAVTA